MPMDFVSLEEKIFNFSVQMPNKTALIEKKRTISYRELYQNIWSTKLFLEKEYSIIKGDTVVVAANKNLNFIYAYFAIHLIGAKVIPLDEQIQKDRLAFIIEKTKPRLIIGLENEDKITSFDFSLLKDLELINIRFFKIIREFNLIWDIY